MAAQPQLDERTNERRHNEGTTKAQRRHNEGTTKEQRRNSEGTDDGRRFERKSKRRYHRCPNEPSERTVQRSVTHPLLTHSPAHSLTHSFWCEATHCDTIQRSNEGVSWASWARALDTTQNWALTWSVGAARPPAHRSSSPGRRGCCAQERRCTCVVGADAPTRSVGSGCGLWWVWCCKSKSKCTVHPSSRWRLPSVLHQRAG